jgi:hypothetical protein
MKRNHTMQLSRIRWRWGWLLAFASLALLRSLQAQSFTQSITLNPGWNAVWLEVQPEDNAADAVFGALPVASVWSRGERTSSADFIQDPSEEAFNQAGWLGWFPPSRPEAFLGNLFAVYANRAYLIKSTNGTPLNWTVTGRPSLRQPEWVPDALNLRGLPVDPASPPTFLKFFLPSPAHYAAAASRLETIYRLNSASGQWVPASATDTVRSGEAYWIYTRGASDYLAPLRVRGDLGDGLDFGLQLTELSLRLENLSTAPGNAIVRDLNFGAGTRLAYQDFDPSSGAQWSVLPDPLGLSALPDQEQRLRLAVRRQDMGGTNYQTVLEVRDGAGTRWLVPVTAEKLAGNQPGSDALAGLWLGTATLDAVSEPGGADPATPTPTQSKLNLRLLIHVDSQGQARLLKEVIQMWRDGTYTNTAAGDRVVDKSGSYVLLTDDTLIPLFKGATVRDGESVGRRFSTVGYDFAGGTTNNFVNLNGKFGVGETLTGTLTLPANHPRNPFKHKYHPDHDNLNARFDGPAQESYEPVRQISLAFAPEPPDGPAVPDFGYNEMGGHYQETITGLHKVPITVSGSFRLSRVSRITELNPNPRP